MTDTKFYRNSREHLEEELLKLDGMLELQVKKHRVLPGGKGHDGFSGLYITEEEIDWVSRRRWGTVPGENSSGTAERKVLLEQVKKLRETISKKAENSIKSGIDLPLFRLASLFQLNSIESDILLICLAPELDMKYEKLYAYLQDDITKKSPSVNLIMDLLCDTPDKRIEVRPLFLLEAPLLKYSLIRFVDDQDGSRKPLLSRLLKLDDRIVDFLLEMLTIDVSLISTTRLVNPQRDWSTIILEKELKERLTRLSKKYSGGLTGPPVNGLVFYFFGPYGAGKKSAAEAFCQELNLSLLTTDMRDLMNCQPGFEKTIQSLFRESLLQPAAVYIENFDLLLGGGTENTYYRRIILKAADEYSWLTFLSGEKSWDTCEEIGQDMFIRVEFAIPSYSLRKRLWQMSLNGGRQIEVSQEVDIDALANKFQLTGGQIRDAVAHSRNLALMRSKKDIYIRITKEDLYQGCRAQSNQKLSEMARKIKPHFSWSDIVLPGDQLQQLKEIQRHVKYRQKVFFEWGFERKLSSGKGLNILFCGPSGTGKTMAADVIAHELCLDLYKIDLSCVVSKYIGETEKNLAGIFKEAETANAILFFDEADALFGKRSEVKDSHDRYANIEIGYLLQKMEEYEGVVILATNMRKNMDEAFVRRMFFTVEFPFPDEDYRLRIWQNIFPQETPLDKKIDFDFLKQNFKVTGGNIKNIALTAAFYAADDGQMVTMEHLVLAGKREFQKMGKLCVKDDFGKYYELITPLERP